MFGMDRLDLYDLTLNEIHFLPIRNLWHYISKLYSNYYNCLTNIQKLKEFCMQFICQINIETLWHKANFFHNLKVLQINSSTFRYLLEIDGLHYYTINDCLNTEVTFACVKAEYVYDILPVVRELILNIWSWNYTMDSILGE